MINTSVQTTVKVPENLINQLSQEMEALRERLLEIENFLSKEGNDRNLFFLFFVFCFDCAVNYKFIFQLPN